MSWLERGGGRASRGRHRERLPGRMVVPIPGRPSGQQLTIDLSDERLAALLREEIGAVLGQGLDGLKGGRSRLGALRKSTIERKRRRGSSTPAQPFRDTGALERSLELVEDGGEFSVVCNDYVFKIMRGRFWPWAEAALGTLTAALDRALVRFMAEVVS